jgi:hypothetical protein
LSRMLPTTLALKVHETQLVRCGCVAGARRARVPPTRTHEIHAACAFTRRVEGSEIAPHERVATPVGAVLSPQKLFARGSLHAVQIPVPCDITRSPTASHSQLTFEFTGPRSGSGAMRG